MGRPMIWLRSAPVAGASSRITNRSWRVHSKTSAAHAHEHIFLGEAHDAHERRTRWVVALTAGMMVVEIIAGRSEEHTSELQSIMRSSYAVFCLKKTKTLNRNP